MELRAKITPYSSVVGQGIAFEDENGRVVGQIALLNSTEIIDYKAYSSGVARALKDIVVSVPDTAVRRRDPD